MLRVSIKGILARKLRLLLTSVAIVLGVGFVSGSYFLTDAMRGSFDDLFDQATAKIDVEVRTSQYVKLRTAQDEGVLVPIDLAEVGMSPETLSRIRDVDGVRQAEGLIFELGAQPLGKDGKPITEFGPPSFAAGWSEPAKDLSVLRIDKGRPPGDGELALDATAYERSGHELGDDVKVLIQGGRTTETFELVGVVKFGDSNNLNGASITMFEPTQLQGLLDMDDRYSVVDVVGDPGIEQDELSDRIADELGDEFHVVTAPELSAESSEAIDNSFLKYLEYIILGFAFVAVFVGAFTIFNTFTILVGQRTREFGLLRILGARRPQIIGIVALEALVVGVVASTIGIVVGYGIAGLLRVLLNAFGFEIPNEPFPIEARTIIVSYIVGVLVTLVASVVPAWRASRLSPLEAIRTTSTSHDRGWKVPAAGAVLFVIGAVLVVRGLAPADGASTEAVLTSLGAGFLVTIVGLAMLSRLFIAPVTRVLAVVFARGRTGALAKGNVLRNRGRAATTASALMIGLALASLVLVFYASLQATVDDQIERSFGADVSAYNNTFGGSSPTISDENVDKMREVDGVEELAVQYYGTAIVGDEFDLGAESPKPYVAYSEGAVGAGEGLVRAKLIDGDIDPGSEIVVSDEFAEEHDLDVGSDVELAFPAGDPQTLEVQGIFEASEIIGAGMLVSPDTFLDTQPAAAHGAAFVAIDVADGTKPSTVVTRIDQVLGDDSKFIEVLDTEGLKQFFRDQLAPIVGMVFALLSLSIVIALFGISNTLALNVFERTREIGLLRAVGGTRRQLRRVIRAESILVALFGAIVGVLVGVGAGAALISALSDEGFVFGISPLAVVGVLIGGFIAGVLAAVLPARRAARTDVLQAIATE